MKHYDFLVVGGGFQGIAAAAMLRKEHDNVAILERANGLGGIMRGKEHNGLILDFGCHLFNNDESEITALMLEIMEGNHHPVSVKYAGITQGHKLDGMAVPSFSSWPEKKKEEAFQQILAKAKEREAGSSTSYKNLYEWLVDHYGDLIAPEIYKILQKSCGHDAKNISADTIYKTQVACIHLIENEDFLLPLKNSIKELDKILALPSQDDEMRFYRDAEKHYKHRTFYPSTNGMRGFADSAHKYLKGKGVSLLLGKTITSLNNESKGGVTITLDNDEKISVDKLVWTLDIGMLSQLVLGENTMSPYLLKVPATLFYHFVSQEVEPAYTYLHDFSADTHIYRVSSAGFYGNQVNEKGQSYLCSEVFTKTDSDIWKNPEQYSDTIWNEIKATGMIDIDQPENSFQMSTPATYPIYKNGYEVAQQKLTQHIEENYPDIINLNMNAYTKNDIVRVVSKVIQNFTKAA